MKRVNRKHFRRCRGERSLLVSPCFPLSRGLIWFWFDLLSRHFRVDRSVRSHKFSHHLKISQAHSHIHTNDTMVCAILNVEKKDSDALLSALQRHYRYGIEYVFWFRMAKKYKQIPSPFLSLSPSVAFEYRLEVLLNWFTICEMTLYHVVAGPIAILFGIQLSHCVAV